MNELKNISQIQFPLGLQIQKIVKETALSKTFYLIAGKGKIPFQSGQYITFNENPSNPATSRNYSIANASYEKELAITIKRQANGYFSRMMIDDKKVGDSIQAIGIFGHFVLPTDISNHHFLMFAAGSGIVPIFSLIKEILHTHSQCIIELFYSSASKQETIFYKQLQKLSVNYVDRFHIRYFLSQENHISEARISAFMIPAIIAKRELPKTLAYLCGPLDYMDTIRMSLLTYGLSKENVFTEEFSYLNEGAEYEAIPPPDKGIHQVLIHLHNETKSFQVAYPDSILKAALKKNIHLPYSCSSGQCGSCTARLLKGEIWLSYNEVLTEQQIQDGFTLTCMGFPINGDVEISYD